MSERWMRALRAALDEWERRGSGATSGVHGGGAIAAAERAAATRIGAQYVISVGSATMGLYAAMSAVGVCSVVPVQVDVDEWPAAVAAARALGAELRDCADIVVTSRDPMPAVARGAIVVEDRARLSPLEARPVAGAVAVYSLGPGKAVDCGEGGLVATDDNELAKRVVATVCHPVRQVIAGLSPDAANLASRMHPAAAVLLWHRLRTGAQPS